MPVNCVHTAAGLRCLPSLDVPFVVGIGPAKSGSTAVFRTLSSHSRVEIGSAGRRGECCFSELYFFVRPFDRKHHNLSVALLQEYFATPFGGAAGGSVSWFGEKTPRYSGHTLVPFLVRTLLPEARLVYTLRSADELDASLYRFRAMHDVMSYDSWVARRVEAHRAWEDCRAAQLRQIGGAALTPPWRLYDGGTPHAAVEAIEALLHGSCGQGAHHANGTLDTFRDVLPGASLRRWAFSFAEERILCVRMLDHLNDWPTVRASRRTLGRCRRRHDTSARAVPRLFHRSLSSLCAQVAARLGRFLDVAPAGFHRSAGEEHTRLTYVSPLASVSASEATRAALAAEVARDDAESGEWTRRLCGSS